MTTLSKVNIVGTIALSFLLAVPGVALAGKSGGKSTAGNSGPKESVSINYGKTEYTYKSQTAGSKKGSGNATHRDFSFTHKSDKASPQ